MKLNPVYDKCKEEIDIAKYNIEEIETLEKDPENYIFDYFEELKRQVDLRREILKLKLDECSDEIIQSIECTKKNCINLKLSSEIKKSKEDLNKLTDRFDTFEID